MASNIDVLNEKLNSVAENLRTATNLQFSVLKTHVENQKAHGIGDSNSDFTKYIDSKINEVIQDKIDNGEISGGNGDSNDPNKPPVKPSEPEDPGVFNPEAPASEDFWETLNDPDGTDKYDWDQIAEPDKNVPLNGGAMYSAPTIAGAEYWRGGDQAFIRLTPPSNMTSKPAKYAIYVQSLNTTVEVNADSEGYVRHGFALATDVTTPKKDLIAAVAIDSSGNRSAVAKKVFRVIPYGENACVGMVDTGTTFAAPTITCETYWIENSVVTINIATTGGTPVKYVVFVQDQNNIVQVDAASGKASASFTLPESLKSNCKALVAVAGLDSKNRPGAIGKKILRIVEKDYVLPPNFTTPGADGDPINNEHVVMDVKPFATLCGNKTEVQEAARYRILDSNKQVVFDSNTLDVTGDRKHSYAAYAPDLLTDPDLEYTLQAQMKGATLGWSGWSSRKVKISKIKTPSMVAPTNNAKLDFGHSTPAWGTSPFTMLGGGMDVHQKTEVKISTDNLGLAIEGSLLTTTGSTSGNLPRLDKYIATEQTMYVFGRHVAQVCGNSAWSTPVVVTCINGMKSIHGRTLYRRDDIECVCLEFDYWGAKKTLQIPYAKHRPEAGLAAGTYGTDIPGIPNISTSSFYLNGSALGNTADMPVITDTTLQSKLSAFRNDGTGRNNTTAFSGYTDAAAAKYCRNLNIGKLGTGYFDLGNAYEMSVIWIESDNIDALDPTADSYPNNKLGKTNPKGRFYNGGVGSQWSSSECNSANAWCVNYNGGVASPNKNGSVGVVPSRVI